MPALTPRNIALGAGAVVAATYLFPRSIKKVAPIDNPLETPGVKAVGARYAAQGGTTTHQPGVATPLGNPDKTSPNQTNLKGPGSGAFEETQADQKVGYSSEPAKKWYQANLGNDKGK